MDILVAGDSHVFAGGATYSPVADLIALTQDGGGVLLFDPASGGEICPSATARVP
ncbi:hypothetical protein ABZ297_46170 [Nonomuraea sp. NPDC005983]|uniref:hypothetical protein n=1 Tax=Nonomuraea sp. NPDC005983 TaxID=3155595 RepID=UPI0033B91199